MRVLRIYHSAVVGPWRRRDRAMRELGAEVVTMSPIRWDEGGAMVELDPETDEPVVGAPTIGHHPYLFLYDPRPIWRELRRREIDVLDIHEEPASLAAAEVLALTWLSRRRPAVCLYCAQNLEKRYPVPFRWFERIALRRAAAVHTCNDEAGEILRRKGFEGIIVNLGLGVDIERFRPPARTDVNGTKLPRVGYIGRLEAHKGVDVLIEALVDAPGCSLQIIGDGPERARLEQLVVDRGLTDRVEIQGHVAHDELPERIALLDVAVVPSLETSDWIEQFGRVAVEVMAAGVAIIASDSGSLPEVIGDAGVLVPPGEVGALRQALQDLVNDPDERRRRGAAGRERARRYSWPEVAQRHVRLYQEMVG